MQITDPQELTGMRVVDANGARLGKVARLYRDNQADRPEWVGVNTDRLGRHESLVPVSNAERDGKRLRVPYSRTLLAKAPHHEPGQEVSGDEQAALLRHYGLAHRADSGTVQPGPQAPSAGGHPADASTSTMAGPGVPTQPTPGRPAGPGSAAAAGTTGTAAGAFDAAEARAAGKGRGRGMVRTARSRGVLTGAALVLLGLWGGLVPFIGPYLGYGYAPGTPWTFTWPRFWLEILPAAATILGGLVLLSSANRLVAHAAGWLAALAGAWFVVGPSLGALAFGTPIGTPLGISPVSHVAASIGMFIGLGAAILWAAGMATGRFSVRGVRDQRSAERFAARRDTERAAAHRPAHRPAR